ncbi:MAG: SBBP repeat-containing protein [Candidatus Hermodarchaeota archaeon]
MKPGADPSAIRFRYEGIERLSLDTDGSVVVHTEAGILRDANLWMYQDTPQGRQIVTGEFTVYGPTTFGFQVLKPYNSFFPLVIDPLIWSTFLGGGGYEYPQSSVLDSSNNVYITGYTNDVATDFPTTPGAINETHNGGTSDVFVCKLSADGTSLVYSTFLGDQEGIAAIVLQ